MYATGTRNPNSARLGMVWATFAKPTIQRRARLRRASQMPPGTAIRVAITTAISTISRCSRVSEATSGRISGMRVLLFEGGQKGTGFGGLRAAEFGGRRDGVHRA